MKIEDKKLPEDLWISPDQEFSDVSQHLLTLEPPGLENEDHDHDQKIFRTKNFFGPKFFFWAKIFFG